MKQIFHTYKRRTVVSRVSVTSRKYAFSLLCMNVCMCIVGSIRISKLGINEIAKF